MTSGANQAFINVVLTLLDPGDRVILFVPYYFNHLMAVQMTGGADNVVHGKCDPQSWHPNLDWLEQELSQPNPPKMVVLVNPCNPTGNTWTAALAMPSQICRTLYTIRIDANLGAISRRLYSRCSAD